MFGGYLALGVRFCDWAKPSGWHWKFPQPCFESQRGGRPLQRKATGQGRLLPSETESLVGFFGIGPQASPDHTTHSPRSSVFSLSWPKHLDGRTIQATSNINVRGDGIAKNEIFWHLIGKHIACWRLAWLVGVHVGLTGTRGDDVNSGCLQYRSGKLRQSEIGPYISKDCQRPC